MEQRLFDCGQYAVTVTVGGSLRVRVGEDGYEVFSMNIECYKHSWHEGLLERALSHYIEYKDVYRISEWVQGVTMPY